MLASAREESHVEPALFDPKPDIVGMLATSDDTRDAIRKRLAAEYPRVELMASKKALMRADLSAKQIEATFGKLRSRPLIPKRRISDFDNGDGGVGLG